MLPKVLESPFVAISHERIIETSMAKESTTTCSTLSLQARNIEVHRCFAAVYFFTDLDSKS